MEIGRKNGIIRRKAENGGDKNGGADFDRRR